MMGFGRIGLGLVPTGPRSTTPVPPHLLALVPKPQGKNETVKSAGADPILDTVPLIKRLARRQMWQGKKLAHALKGATVEETLRNDFDFIFNHIQYVPDKKGEEQVRSLRRLVHEGKGDCDCFTNALSNLLLNQGIEHELRVAAYDTNPNSLMGMFRSVLTGLGLISAGDWQHIYINVPLAGGRHITVDPVVHRFNYEVPTAKTKDFKMKLVSLDGPMAFAAPSFGYLGACPPKPAAPAAVAPGTTAPTEPTAPGVAKPTKQYVTFSQLKNEGKLSVQEILMEENFDFEPAPGGYEVQTKYGKRTVPNIIAMGDRQALLDELNNPTVEKLNETKSTNPNQWSTAAKWAGGILLSALALTALFGSSKPSTKALAGPPKQRQKKRLAVAQM